MSYRLSVTEIAMQQAFELEDWYEAAQKGRGEVFIDALFECYQYLEERPFRWPVIRQEVRRALLASFKCSVFYRVKDDTVLILAVIHQAADPGKWPV
jgi:plasmid stabilization system protein ParE